VETGKKTKLQFAVSKASPSFPGDDTKQDKITQHKGEEGGRSQREIKRSAESPWKKNEVRTYGTSVLILVAEKRNAGDRAGNKGGGWDMNSLF